MPDQSLADAVAAFEPHLRRLNRSPTTRDAERDAAWIALVQAMARERMRVLELEKRINEMGAEKK